MGAYLSISVHFRSYDKEFNIVSDLHNLYNKYGLSLSYIYCKEGENISYEDACIANQKCFDELIEFEEWEHYRICWKCDWVSFVDTFPCINIIMPNYENSGVPYYIQKDERILFPENEINKKVFNKILQLVADLYKLDFVHSISIEKEE